MYGFVIIINNGKVTDYWEVIILIEKELSRFLRFCYKNILLHIEFELLT